MSKEQRWILQAPRRQACSVGRARELATLEGWSRERLFSAPDVSLWPLAPRKTQGARGHGPSRRRVLPSIVQHRDISMYKLKSAPTNQHAGVMNTNISLYIVHPGTFRHAGATGRGRRSWRWRVVCMFPPSR